MKKAFSQEQILYYLTSVMTLVEGECYTIRNIDLAKKFIPPSKKLKIKGYLYIIASEEYWKKVDKEFIKGALYSESQYEEICQNEKNALFLKYDYKNRDSHKFKNMPLESTDKRIASNIDSFPYLLKAIERLCSNASITNCYEETIIYATLEELKSEVSKLKSIAKNDSIKTKPLIKVLNSLTTFRKMSDYEIIISN